MKINRSYILVLLIVCCSTLAAQSAYAAPPKKAFMSQSSSPKRNTELLKRRSSMQKRALEIKALRTRQKKEAVAYAKSKNMIVRQVMPDNRVIEIQRFENNHPIYYQTLNLNSAKTISADRVWPGGSTDFNLSGNGIALAIWDAGHALSTHQEFGGRIITKDSASVDGHSTHVAGTMGAAGIVAAAKGLSFQATIESYDWNNVISEMTTAAGNNTNASNHSYGYSLGWGYVGPPIDDWVWWGNIAISTTEDFRFGFYNTETKDTDNFAHSFPNFVIVKAAGNDRGTSVTGWHIVYDGTNYVYSNDPRDPDGGLTGYDTIGPVSTAKNIITVGAVQEIPNGYSVPGDVVMSSFSGWGPADDGRIKPDIVAKGVDTYSAYISNDAAYVTMNGTSMATPAITGMVGLIQHHQKNLFGTTPMLSSTIKGLLLHTADEAGANPGPDYAFGWGLANTKTATDLMTDHKNGNIRILERSLSNSSTITESIKSDGSGPLKVTICWTDPSGTPTVDSLDPTTLMLVNDLDLRIERLTPSSATFNPWVLDPSNPANAATTGDNTRDNIEQVYIQSPVSGDYTIKITHKGTLASAQDVSILITGTLDVAPPSIPRSFSANAGDGKITLNWVNPSAPDFQSVMVRRSMADNINTTANGIEVYSGTDQSFTDTQVNNNNAYYYAIFSGDTSGHWSTLSKASAAPTGVFQVRDLIFGPNPFNPNQATGKIQYWLSKAAKVKLFIFSISGEKLFEKDIPSGSPGGAEFLNSVDWNGQNSFGEPVANGVYIAYLTANDGTTTIKKKLKIAVLR